ncbi:MAG: response regulator [Pseudomonadota bacterium]
MALPHGNLAAADDPSTYSVESVHITRLRALVIEPSLTQQKILTTQLEEQGISDISCCKSGLDGLDLMHANAPDLVISAMYLSDMTGTELIQRIRASEAIAQTAFLLISSETDLRTLDPIRQAGAIGILPKPFDTQDLQKVLCATVDLQYPSQVSVRLDVDEASIRVLLVDDSQASRRHLIRVLNILGLDEIDQAGDGREAVELLQNGDYSIIVTDYHMPLMDGRQLTDYVRRESACPEIPILMVTGEQSGERLAAVEQAGVSALCDKPFEPQAIRSLVAKLLGLDER